MTQNRRADDAVGGAINEAEQKLIADSGCEQNGSETRARFKKMDKSELEALAAAVILEHRQLLAADQLVYEEWTRAESDPSVSDSIRQALKNEHIARQAKSALQQQTLSDILDALGFVPAVDADD